ncbi:hypothetical protein MNV49_002920 [Pseudohyphozyma bogoriensis]|nr:hypothetical protein MNV49_002920 [Pseudohyphozyma bogoriensis]
MSGFLTKIAHSNRVSMGPKDIKPLADLISAEKRAVEAVQRMSTERTKASFALREWGNAEGNDLGDVLTKMAMLFDYLSGAENTFAEHDNTFRMHFKSIRTKEEHLASLKRSKDKLQSNIESQDKKVSKMKEENKDLPAATTKLLEMRQEMVGLENTVINEETKLSDFKRSTTREAMSLKLGAILELAEKTVIIGEIGKLIIDEIPTERTEPGMPRAHYQGYDRTDEHMHEALRCLGEVVFNPTPLSPGPDQPGTGGEERRDSEWGGGAGGAYNQDSYHQQYADQHQQYADQHQQYPDQHQQYGDHQQNYGGHQQQYGQYEETLEERGGFREDAYQRDGAGGGYQNGEHSGLHVNTDYAEGAGGAGMLPAIQATSPLGMTEEEGREIRNETYAEASARIGGPAGGQDSSIVNNRSSLAYMDDDEALEREQEEQRQREEEWAKIQQSPRSPTMEEKAHFALPVLPEAERNAPYPQEKSATSPTSPSAYSAAETTAPAPAPVESSPAPTSSNFYSNAYDNQVSPLTTSASNMSLNNNTANSGISGAFVPTRNARPIHIRGDSALGSKHGDVYVPNTNGAQSGLPPGAGPGPFPSAGTSGYNSRGGGGDASSINSGRITAGAFRRQPPQSQFSLPPVTMDDGRYPSEANRIRDQYYASNVPLPANSANGGAGVGAEEAPRFDTSPLQVQQKRMAPTRSGSVPVPASDAESYGYPRQRPSMGSINDGWRSGEQQQQQQQQQPQDAQYASHAPPSYASGPVSPPSSNAGPGFGSSQFVTRLD